MTSALRVDVPYCACVYVNALMCFGAAGGAPHHGRYPRMDRRRQQKAR